MEYSSCIQTKLKISGSSLTKSLYGVAVSTPANFAMTVSTRRPPLTINSYLDLVI